MLSIIILKVEASICMKALSIRGYSTWTHVHQLEDIIDTANWLPYLKRGSDDSDGEDL